MERQGTPGGRAQGPPYGFNQGGLQYSKQQQPQGLPGQLQGLHGQGAPFHNQLLQRPFQPQQQGPLRLQQQGALHPQQQGVLHPQHQGTLHPQQQGALHPQQQGPLHPQQQRALHPQQQGPPHPQQQGALHPQQQGALHPQQQGALHPQQQGALYPQQQGALHPQQQGPLHPQQQGALHPQQQGVPHSQQGALNLQQHGAIHPQQQGLPFQHQKMPPFQQPQPQGSSHLQSQGTPSQQQQPLRPSFQGGTQPPTYKQSPSQGPPRLPRASSDQYNQSCTSSFQQPQWGQPPGPKAQVQVGLGSTPQPQQPSFQGQSTNQHALLQGMSSSKQPQELSYPNRPQGHPIIEQDPLQQLQGSPFRQVEHQVGPYQRNKSFPLPHVPDSHGITHAAPQAARSSVPPGQGAPLFLSSTQHILSASQPHSSSSESHLNRDVNRVVHPGTAFSRVSHYVDSGGRVSPMSSLDTGVARSNLGNQQDLRKAIAGGPTIQVVNQLPRFSSFSEQNNSVQQMNRVQMQSNPTHNQPTGVQMPGNYPFQQPDNTSGKSNSQFSTADQKPMQCAPPVPLQARTLDQSGSQLPYSDKSHMQTNHLIPQPTRTPVQGSLSLIRSHEAQVSGNTPTAILDRPPVVGNSPLPHLDMAQMKKTLSFSSSTHAQIPVGPLLPPPDRVQMHPNPPFSGAVQRNGTSAQDGRPVVHSGVALAHRDGSFNNPNLASAQSNQSPYRFQTPPVQSGIPFPPPAGPPPQSGPQFPPPRMPPMPFALPLPPMGTSAIQGGPSFTYPSMPPVPWPLNAELFSNLSAPPVTSVDNQLLLTTKEPTKEAANQVLDETEQQKQDELWLSRFLASRRKTLKPLVKAVRLSPIAEARELVYGAQKLVSELRMVCQMLQDNSEDETVWSELYLQATNINKELQDKMKALNQPGYIEGVKKKMEKIQKKRLRIQREKQETPAQKEEAARAAEREAKIDKWRMKQIREVDEKKREREVQAAADSVLSEVLKKQGDTKRMVSVLRALEKLRKLRKEAAARKGVSPPPSADETFENHIKRLRILIKERTELYDAEERALRVMLEGEQEEERNRERERKQRKERERLLNQKREIDFILFGEPEELPPDHPLQTFKQFYQLAEHSLPGLIQIRTEWDRYLVPADHPGGTCIPPSWVLPGPPSSDVWAAAVKQTD